MALGIHQCHEDVILPAGCAVFPSAQFNAAEAGQRAVLCSRLSSQNQSSKLPKVQLSLQISQTLPQQQGRLIPAQILQMLPLVFSLHRKGLFFHPLHDLCTALALPGI